MVLKRKASARENVRYLLIQGKKGDVEKTILDYIGILGWAKANPRFVSLKGLERGEIVLAVERKEVVNVRAAFAISKTSIKVNKVSGTLKGLVKRKV